MRCYCCNHILSKAEATRKFSESGAFTEMCNACLTSIEDNDNLALEEGVYDEEEEDEE